MRAVASSAGTTGYSYDANGNLVAQSGLEGSFAYAYTAENCLRAVRLDGEVVMAAVYSQPTTKARRGVV